MGKSERDYALQLLEMAGKDQRALANMRDTDAFSEEVFGFHAQQAVEKALKAWLPAWIASIRELTTSANWWASCETPAQRSRFTNFQNYSGFAVEYRYAAYNPAEGPLDRAKAIEETAALIAHVRGILSQSDL